MRVTKRQLKRIIAEESRRLQRLREDSVDNELDNLKKNIGDDIEHIRDLKDDIKDDHDEERRAEEEKHRKNESFSRRKLRRQIRRTLRESILDMDVLQMSLVQASNEVASSFADLMMKLVDEDPDLVADPEAWQEEVYRAQDELEADVETALNSAIERVEAALHNGNYSRD